MIPEPEDLLHADAASQIPHLQSSINFPVRNRNNLLNSFIHAKSIHVQMDKEY